MRVNVYAEELTTECQLVKKTADTGVIFYGLRFFLKSHPDLHHDDDDDRTGVTLWVPWTQRYGHDFGIMSELLANLGTTLSEAITEDCGERGARTRNQPLKTNAQLRRDLARTIAKAVAAGDANSKDRLLDEIADMLGFDEEDLEPEG